MINPINPPPPPNPNTRVTNVVHIPYFLGRPSADPDTHVAKFEMACSANNILAAKTLEVFVASMQEEAFAWYLRQPPLADWNALKIAFLDHLRPLEFANSLKERLRTIRMGINERWTTITGGCKILCNIWEPTLCILYVYPIELKTYVKEGGTSTYAQAYGRAKIWEGCRLKFGTTVH